MHTYFAEYLALLRRQNEELKSAFAGLPTEALDWAPAPAANSLVVLATHVAGAEGFYLGDLLGGHPSQRDRDAEFATQRIDALTLAARLDAVLDEAAHRLAPLTPDDLSSERYSARHQRNLTVAWLLHHTLAHTAQHVGHAQLTRQLWEQQSNG